MADHDRTAAHGLEFFEELHREPFRFGFFAALRKLECVHSDKPRLGTGVRPADDAVRLAQDPSLAFAPSTLSAFVPSQHGLPPRLFQSFLGLFGPNGPLPLHLTEYARDRLYNSRDPTFARFADMFHHRLLTLFYRGWAAAQPTVSYDRPQSDRFALYIGSLFGLGMPSLRNRDAIPDLSKLRYAGRLACQSRHPEGLQAMLSDFLQMPVEITEFIGQWIDLPEECQCLLGGSPETTNLGINTTVGSQVWDCQQKFRITVGPIGHADYQRLLPGGESLKRVVALVHSYIGFELTWDLKLVLCQDEIPPTKLWQMGQLGWTTWIASEPIAQDADDLLLDPHLNPGDLELERPEPLTTAGLAPASVSLPNGNVPIE